MTTGGPSQKPDRKKWPGLSDRGMASGRLKIPKISAINNNILQYLIPEQSFALGNTPLMYACASGHIQTVRVLLDAGANVEDHNENGHTPLMEAASAGHVEVAKVSPRLFKIISHPLLSHYFDHHFGFCRCY